MSELKSLRVIVVRRAYSDVPDRVIRLRAGQTREAAITKAYPGAYDVMFDGFMFDGDAYYADQMHTDSF